MTRTSSHATARASARSRLFAPLVHLAALLLLLEEWCWDTGMRLGARIGRWRVLQLVEARVRRLPPYGALCVFVLPGLLLFPVKVLALVAIAHGHAASGIATIVAAKLGGAAVVARLYVLTLPTLLALGWFARCHGWFMGAKERCLARLRASLAFQHSARLMARMRLGLRLAGRRLRRLFARKRHAPSGSRHASRVSRVLRRFVVQWRARRPTQNDKGRP